MKSVEVKYSDINDVDYKKANTSLLPKPIDYRKSYIRWVVLAFGSLCMYGIYSCYDFPAYMYYHI